MSDHIPTLFDEPEPILPVLPYGRTSGWSGSDTSRERATQADRNGVTSERQKACLDLVYQAGIEGITWRELSDQTGWHHGTASGALSVLHKGRLIARLTERRDRSRIYVMPEFILGREISDYTPNVSARILQEVLAEIEDDILNDRKWEALRRIRATRETYQ